MLNFATKALGLLSDWRGRSFGTFNQSVPKDSRQNLMFRRLILKSCSRSAHRRKVVLAMCRQDPWFWVNSFVWTDARKLFPGSPIRPFITWPYQDGMIWEIKKAIGLYSLVIPKSRDLGMSWVPFLPMLHHWLFDPPELKKSFTVMSKNKETVDKIPGTNTLFYKLDFILEHLRDTAPWMLPKGLDFDKHRIGASWQNPANGAVFAGCATTDDSGRGDKDTCKFIDEFPSNRPSLQEELIASLGEACNCNIFVGTFKSAIAPFNDLVFEPNPVGYKVLPVHWIMHPHKAHAATWNGDDFPIVPGFTLRKGEITSPWFEWKCQREKRSPRMIAREIAMIPQATGGAVFDPVLLNRLRQKSAHWPMHTGKLKYLGGNESEPVSGIRWVEGRDDDALSFPLRFWVPVKDGKLEGNRRLCMGIDVATGTVQDGRGNSNSAIAVLDVDTGEKIGEYARSGIPVHQFAAEAAALAIWLGRVRMIWENRGPGDTFREFIWNVHRYRLVYFHCHEHQTEAQPTDTPGWEPTQKRKDTMLEEFFRALGEGEYVTHSSEELSEVGEYVEGNGGHIQHQATVGVPDPTGARNRHGDRVGSAALGWKLARIMCPHTAHLGQAKATKTLKRLSDIKADAPVGSPAWMIKELLEKESKPRLGMKWRSA